MVVKIDRRCLIIRYLYIFTSIVIAQTRCGSICVVHVCICARKHVLNQVFIFIATIPATPSHSSHCSAPIRTRRTLEHTHSSRQSTNMLRLVGSAVARRSGSLSSAAVRTFAAMPEPQTQPDVLYTGVSVPSTIDAVDLAARY